MIKYGHNETDVGFIDAHTAINEHGTVGYATRNEQFLTIKSGCYNKCG
jgi:hypothetical protein